MRLVNESCSPEWKDDRTSDLNKYGTYELHRTARTLQQCQYACVFNRECLAINWQSHIYCYMYTQLNDEDVHASSVTRYDVYKLINRCNVTSGLLLVYVICHLWNSFIFFKQVKLITAITSQPT